MQIIAKCYYLLLRFFIKLFSKILPSGARFRFPIHFLLLLYKLPQICGLEQHKLIILHFWRSEVRNGFRWTAFLLQAPWEMFPCLFQPPEAVHILSFAPLSSHL